MKSKLKLILLVLTVAMFTASTAFASIELSSRSEWMRAASYCDQAGSITLTFDSDDIDIVNDYLDSGEDFVRIRVTLTGTDIDPTVDPPTLWETAMVACYGATPQQRSRRGQLVRRMPPGARSGHWRGDLMRNAGYNCRRPAQAAASPVFRS